jgi:hypothetical protein
MTEEQLGELFRTDPVKAIGHMLTRAQQTIEANIDRRIKPLLGGTADAVEQAARARYPDEFAVLGDEITRFVATLPDRSVLSTSKAWDDLVAYIRGQPASFDKLVDHRANKKKAADAAMAQAGQAVAAGATIVSPTRPAASTGKQELDPTAREIAKTLGMTDAEYITWRDVA